MTRLRVEGGRFWLDGREVVLTKFEAIIADVLARNAGHIVSKTRLAELLWGYDRGDETWLRSYVWHTRRKLPDVIRLRRGLGWYMEKEDVEYGGNEVR